MKNMPGLLAPFLAAMLILCAPAAARAGGGETASILALGRAPLGANQAAAKDLAVERAIEQAVGREAMTLVDAAALRTRLGDLRRLVLDDARRFVAAYRLESHAVGKQEVWALVSVTVDRKALDKVLASGGLSLPAARRSLTLTLVAEEASPGRPVVYWWSGAPGAPPAPPLVAGALASLGVKLADVKALAGKIPAESRQAALSESQALALARLAGAGLVILGRVRTYPMVTPEGREPPPAAQLMALDAASGQSLALVEKEGPVFHQPPGPEAGRKVREAVEEAVRDLMVRVAAAAPRETAGPREIQLTISGVRNLADLHHFEKKLSSLTMLVGGLRRESVGAGWARLRLKLNAPPSQLADRLTVLDFKGFLVNVLDISPRGLKLMMIPKE